VLALVEAKARGKALAAPAAFRPKRSERSLSAELQRSLRAVRERSVG
jgi:hypothetical protein